MVQPCWGSISLNCPSRAAKIHGRWQHRGRWPGSGVQIGIFFFVAQLVAQKSTRNAGRRISSAKSKMFTSSDNARLLLMVGRHPGWPRHRPYGKPCTCTTQMPVSGGFVVFTWMLAVGKPKCGQSCRHAAPAADPGHGRPSSCAGSISPPARLAATMLRKHATHRRRRCASLRLQSRGWLQRLQGRQITGAFYAKLETSPIRM